jgi:hypothetical protein
MSLLDFITRRPAVAASRVRIIEATRATALGESIAQDVAPGDVLDVTREDAATLIDAGRAVLLCNLDANGEPTASRKALKPAPTPTTPAPAPASWKELPAPFTRYHELLAKRAALVTDYNAALELTVPPGFRALSKHRDGLKFFAHAVVGTDAVLERIETTEDAKNAAEKVHAFDAANGDALGRAAKATGDATLAKIEAANAAAEELAAIAFQVFSARLAALELDAAHRHRLFAGSGLATRYASFPPINPGCAVSLGGPRPQATLDAPLETLAGLYRLAAARLAGVETLLPQARAELEAAQGVLSPAAKAKRAA